MKWIGGVILLIITIVLLIIAVFMLPWFSTKTNYERERINENIPEYWEESLGGVERDWDESTYYMQSYEMKSSRPLNWSSSKAGGSTSSGKLHYNSDPSTGGWNGNFESMIKAGYPVQGFLPGGPEQLAVFNFTYYILIFSIIMSIICIVFIILGGLEKLGAIVPKVIVGITIIFVIITPLYFALALPPAIESDSKEYQKTMDPINFTASYNRPAEAGGIMGEANEKDDKENMVTAHTEFAPGLGWWLAVGAIFTTIITIGFVTGPGEGSPAEPENRYSSRKYHEFDRPYEKEREREQRYSESYYEEEDQYRSRDTDRYSDEYNYEDRYQSRRQAEYPEYTRKAPYQRAPPPSHGFGRPPPRPPKRRARYPPQRRSSRRPPPSY